MKMEDIYMNTSKLQTRINLTGREVITRLSSFMTDTEAKDVVRSCVSGYSFTCTIPDHCVVIYFKTDNKFAIIATGFNLDLVKA